MPATHVATAFAGATLIDGTGSPPRPGAGLVTRGGQIDWIGGASELDASDDDELRRVDLAGKFLIPGLMDANVHLVADLDLHVLLGYPPGEYDELVLEAAQVALRAGFTTVFDTWGPLESLRRVRDRIDKGEASGSRVLLAGNIIGNGGPYSPDFVPLGDAINPDVLREINHHWEQGVGGELPWMPAERVRDVVRGYIARAGIDFVKYASTAHGFKQFIALSPYSQRAIVEEAHAAGLTAQACAMTGEALKLAIDAGVDLLQHGTSTGLYPMPHDTLQLIAERQLPCVALLYTERHLAAFEEKARNTSLSVTAKRMAIHVANARALIAAGAKVMMAIDGGVLGPAADRSPFWGAVLWDLPDLPYQLGSSHILWLKTAVELGMDPMDALLAATRNIAQAYSRDAELGTLEPGKRADFLVLDADPLEDAENYARIAYVVKDGVIVDRDSLPEHRVLTGAASAGQHES